MARHHLQAMISAQSIKGNAMWDCHRLHLQYGHLERTAVAKIWVTSSICLSLGGFSLSLGALDNSLKEPSSLQTFLGTNIIRQHCWGELVAGG